MSSPVDASDIRLQQLRDWVANACGSIQSWQVASADASFRRYFRVRTNAATTAVIVMDAAPEQEDSRPFVDIAARLRAAGLHVPEVLAQDLERGFLLLSDLGEQTYLHALTADNADRLYQDAINALLQMQIHADVNGLPDYDAALLQRELDLFSDWFLQTHLQLSLSAAERADLDQVFALLIARALAQPRVFVHRDFMPRNLMLSNPNPGILDFQDAVIGPISYDLICLFKDAFISWPQARIDDWVNDYEQRARAAGLPLPPRNDFHQDLDWMGLQRHLKVLGIFARIRHRDGKPHYLADAGRFVEYICAVTPKYPELAPLQALFEQRIMPLLDRQS
ncbi:MAG: phosphotransferase [Gammaproteobacteria bacterium]